MRETQYSEAAAQVLDILNHTRIEDVRKIPQSFIKFLTDISSKSYKSELNYEQSIKGLNLRKQTRELLGFIYITWWCTEEERKKYKILIQNKKIKPKELLVQYDVNDIFQNRKENKKISSIQNEYVEKTSIATYRKENVIKNFLLEIKKGYKI